MKPASSSNGFGNAFLLVGACMGLLLIACSTEEGTTPDCVQDVTADGHQKVDNGCNPFALCIIGNEVKPPAECCKDFMNPAERAACLYGYGETDALSGGGGSGGGG